MASDKADKPVEKAVAEAPKAPIAEMADVTARGQVRGVPAWEVAGMMAAAGWAEGKQVTAGQFERALKAFRERGQGTGPIKL